MNESMSGKRKLPEPTVVILAGGKGRRLLPYTTSFPKPLMPLGDRPILEIILRQLARDGFTKITLAVGHLASLIEAYCGDGSAFGVELSYLHEKTPLGTAGPLTQLTGVADHLLVLNGDILTDLDFSAFYHRHVRHGATATVMTTKQRLPIDYGVLQTDERGSILSYDEKPNLTVEVSGGVYAFSRRALSCIPSNIRFDFPELIGALLDRAEHITAHRHAGHWLDIGRRDDYEEAAELFANQQELFLPSGTDCRAVNDNAIVEQVK